MDRLRDRGNKKWTSIMLPEHVKKLKKLVTEQNNLEKPILDEQQIINNEAIIQGALREDLTVQITYYHNKTIKVVTGKILFINIIGRIIQLEESEVFWEDIINVVII